MASDDPSHPLEWIGPYRVVGKLGQGGMGVVHAAIDPRLERRIAIKVLSKDLSGNPEWHARFTREAKTLASLNHPNIATIHSLERDQSTEFLTMELIDGQNLADLIDSGSLAMPDALSIGRQIARALETAHAAGVIHRDLKPLNVMVTPESHVKVLDFGLARQIGPAGDFGKSDADVTSIEPPAAEPAIRTEAPAENRDTRFLAGPDNGQTLAFSSAGPNSSAPHERSATDGAGTPGYMSPEQIRGEELDAGVDVWAFGCVLFECLAGTRAFEGVTPRDLLRSSLHDGPDLALLTARTPESVRNLIQSCLHQDRGQRLQSLTEARQCLEAALAARAWETIDYVRISPESVTSTNPHNLPTQMSAFVGRKQEVARARELLDGHRLVTLTGVGGGGKTRLAIRVGEESLADFPDGVWVVELAPVADENNVPSAIAQTLRITERPGETLDQTIAAHLARRTLLLILDNCEHVIDRTARLAGTLLQGAPGLKILATSRETLGIPGESVFQVPPLAVTPLQGSSQEALLETDAVRLFAERAALVRPTFSATVDNVETIWEICRRLDGLPLAIELAAARVRVLSLPDILDRLNDRFRLLRGSSREALPHHQTLEALIDWSHTHLTRVEQVLFRRLSIFRGGWTLEAAESVCADEALEAWEILDVLTRLIDKSLVVFHAPRYRMLETVGQYASDRLRESPDVATLEQQFRHWFTSLVETSFQKLTGPEQPQWLERVDADLDNIRRSISQTLTASNSEPALLLTGYMVRYWLIRGLWREGRDASERALAMTRDGPTVALGMALNSLGSCAYQLKDLDTAAASYRESADVLRSLGEPQRAAAPLMNLGNVYRIQGELDRADASYRESLELSDDSNLWMVAAVRTNLGSTALVRDRYDEAGESYRVALGLLRQIGDRIHEAIVLMSLGLVAYKTQKHREALALYEESSAIFDELGERNIGPTVMANTGVVLLALNENDQARQIFARAMRIAYETGNLENVVIGLEGFSTLAARRGDVSRAIRLAGAAEALRQASHVTRIASDLLEWEAELARLEAKLGPEDYPKLWNEGGSLSLEDAFALALQESQVDAPVPEPPAD